MDTYGHLFEGSDRDSAEKMERLFHNCGITELRTSGSALASPRSAAPPTLAAHSVRLKQLRDETARAGRVRFPPRPRAPTRQAAALDRLTAIRLAARVGRANTRRGEFAR